MANFAIVIGIDAYTNQAWNLSAAVNDALGFAEWTLKYGGVTEKNLHLLLSASQGPITTRPYVKADCPNIITTIQKFQDGAGKDGERLYFYYAGHGVAAPGATTGGTAEPVLIPADVQNIRQRYLLIGFSHIIPLLMNVEPKEQFFFIDACRDFALEDSQPAIGAVAPWRPVDPERDQKAGKRSSQYWLYATSPGGKAAEQPRLKGKGIFAAALMDALGGRAPGAMAWSPRGVYEVRLGKLVPYLTQRIRREIGDENQWQRFLQAPEYGTNNGNPDPFLTEFQPDDVENLNVLVRVRPKEARNSCTVRVLLPTQAGDKEVDSKGPPVSLATKFSLRPGDYAFQAVANGFEPKRKLCEVIEALDVNFTLEEGNAKAIFRSPGATSGTLRVSFKDRAGLIVVRNGEGLIENQGTGAVQLTNLLPGVYRVQVLLPEGVAWSKTVEVRAGEDVDLPLDAPVMPLGQAQLAMLATRNIVPDAEGYLEISEYLGFVGSTSLASLLGSAAYAAHWPFGGFGRLHTFGVRSLTDLAEGTAGLLVLVGASGDEPAPNQTVASFLSEARVRARRADGESIGDSGLAILEGFPAAAQYAAELEPGSVNVRLDLPGSTSTSYALACLPNRVAVLIAVADDSGVYDIQQYLVPARSRFGPAWMGFLLNENEPENIRKLEIAQRYYAMGKSALEGFDEQETELLLHGKWLDPLMGCLAGYSLVRDGRAADYVGHPALSPWPDPEESAMRNMLEFFPELPDSHVLAGLCEPGRRAEHYANALARGLPIFAEGVRALIEWHTAEEKKMPPVLSSAAQDLLPGSIWTAWAVMRPALIIQDGHFDRAPLGWHDLEENRSAIEQALQSVGSIEIDDGSGYRHIGTGWVIAKDVVATAGFVVRSNQIDQPFQARITFEAFEGQKTFSVTIGEITFMQDQDRSLPDIALLRRADPLLDGSVRARDFFQILLGLASDQDLPPPLALAGEAPHDMLHRRVYAVGYSGDVRRGGLEADEAKKQAFGEEYGVKRLQPGRVVAQSESWWFEHDCFTLPGNAGSPVIDLDTGLVLGLHVSGLWVQEKGENLKHNQAIALWKLKDYPEFVKTGAHFV